MCQRWRVLGGHPQFTVAVKPGRVNEAIAAAGPGDTLVLQPGFYQEVLSLAKSPCLWVNVRSCHLHAGVLSAAMHGRRCC